MTGHCKQLQCSWTVLASPVLPMSDLHMALWIALVLAPGACHQPLLSLSPLLLVHTLRVARASPRQSELFPPVLADVTEASSQSRVSLKPLEAFPTHVPGGSPKPSGAWRHLPSPYPSPSCEAFSRTEPQSSCDPGFWLLEVSDIYQQASLSQCPRGLFFPSPFTEGRQADDTGFSSILFCP